VPIPDLPPQADLCQLVAAAADLCRKPWRHAVRLAEASAVAAGPDHPFDCTLVLEVRDPGGKRCPEHDRELEIYTSGEQLHLTLAWVADADRPMLWQGSHPVWMAGQSGSRCERPQDGAPLEALARRLRALLS
jgi:hypothetical protein